MADNGGKAWCWLKKRLITVAVVAGALTTIIVALGALDQYRWWVWASEFQVVAGRVYEATIPEQIRVVGNVKRRLERARAVPPSDRDFRDDAKINQLEADLADEKEALEKQIDERARFTK